MTRPAMSSEVATGRWMKGSEIFMRDTLRSGDLLRRRLGARAVRDSGLASGLGDLHVRSWLQFVLAIDDDAFVGLQAFFDQRFPLLRRADFHRPNLHGVIALDHECK